MNNEITRHTLSVLVQDTDSIITRVTGLFSRRGFSLHSLASARTENEGVNRLTIVVDANDVIIEQVTKQLNKLVHVLKVVELDPETSVSRSTMLVKVRTDPTNRPQVVDAVNIFRARIVDVAPESVVVEATGSPGKLRALVQVLEPFGIKELAESGAVALARGPKTVVPGK